jgi:hypothetical protein
MLKYSLSAGQELLHWIRASGRPPAGFIGFRSGGSQLPDCPQILDPLSRKILNAYRRKSDRIRDLGQAGRGLIPSDKHEESGDRAGRVASAGAQ